MGLECQITRGSLVFYADFRFGRELVVAVVDSPGAQRRLFDVAF
jgi:hypothetical protein